MKNSNCLYNFWYECVSGNNHSTPIPEVDRVETPLALALNIVLTTPLTETTTEYYEEEDLDTNFTTPLSQEPGFSWND